MTSPRGTGAGVIKKLLGEEPWEYRGGWVDPIPPTQLSTISNLTEIGSAVQN